MMAKKKNVKGVMWITADGKSDEYEVWAYEPVWNVDWKEWHEDDDTIMPDPVLTLCGEEADKTLKIPAHVKRGGPKAIAKMDLRSITYEKVKNIKVFKNEEE